MASSWKHVIFLLWLSFVLISSLLIFTGGFLLRRNVLENRSKCLQNNSTSNDKQCNKVNPVFDKAVIIIIDALKYEFTKYNESLRVKNTINFFK